MDDKGHAASPEDRPLADIRFVDVVLNGSAGALLDRPDAAQSLVTLFRQAGLEPRFIGPEAGTLPERMEIACRRKSAIVVVVGGDGTIACAAQAASVAGVALGILPFGTMNMLAKDIGIPVGDVEAAVRALAEGEVRDIDIAEVNGHVFLCASMLGLPAHLARYREAGRGRGGAAQLWARFARAALRSFARYRALNLTLQTDGRDPIRLRAAALTITPNPVDDASGRLLGRSCLDGGVLAIYAIRHLALWDVARLSIRVLAGRWRTDPDLRENRGRAVTIAARRRAVHVMNDGETLLLTPPLRYSIRPRGLRVIVPRERRE